MLPTFAVFGVTLSSYGVMCSLGIIVSLIICLVRCRQARMRMEYAFILFSFALAFGLLGAFLTHMVVSYSLKDVFSMIADGTFLKDYSPGFVFYSGLVFGFAAACLVSRLLHFRLSDYAPRLLPSLPFAHAFGRIGCFLAGCCYGIECGWGIVYPPFSSAPAYIPLFPVQLLEALLLVLIGVFLLLYAKKGGARIGRAYVVLYAPTRFMLEFLRGDIHRGIFLHLSTAQWTSLILLILVFLPVKNLRRG